MRIHAVDGLIGIEAVHPGRLAVILRFAAPGLEVDLAVPRGGEEPIGLPGVNLEGCVLVEIDDRAVIAGPELDTQRQL